MTEIEKLLNKNYAFISIILIPAVSSSAYAICEVIDGNTRTPFDGKTLSGLSIEKKSLSTLNREYPQLNALEKAFTGEVQTCTNCSEKYISCKIDKDR